MNSTRTNTEASIPAPEQKSAAMRLEVVAIPVADIDRAKRFYANQLGWRLDADIARGDAFRVVQITPPGSPCSIQFGKGITSAAPGSAQGLFLVVSDVESVRADLMRRGVDAGDFYHRSATEGTKPGLDPERRTYASFTSFSDPDGNRWLVQEVTTRLPGRE
jgi:catechol 2,3-dioxygenase-like lactoylglutathione lyase family enzyme